MQGRRTEEPTLQLSLPLPSFPPSPRPRRSELNAEIGGLRNEGLEVTETVINWEYVSKRALTAEECREVRAEMQADVEFEDRLRLIGLIRDASVVFKALNAGYDPRKYAELNYKLNRVVDSEGGRQ